MKTTDVYDALHAIIDVTQTAQWQFFDQFCTPKAVQTTMNYLYDLAHEALDHLERGNYS